MKRNSSIGLTFVLLLNTVGYYAVFLGLHYSNDIAMSSAIESESFDEANTLTLKIPLSIPYVPDQSNAEMANMLFEHNGESYRLVKQHYAKDTLTLVCVKDTKHQLIDKALSDYVQTFTDKGPDSQSTPNVSLTFVKDYLPASFSIDSSTAGWVSVVVHNLYHENMTPSYLVSIIHPPERA